MAVEIKSDELQWIAEAHPSSIAVVSRLAISHPRANRERLAWAAALLSPFLMKPRRRVADRQSAEPHPAGLFAHCRDLGNVPHMDSSGLVELVQTLATTRKAGGELALMRVTRRLHDLLAITKTRDGVRYL